MRLSRVRYGACLPQLLFPIVCLTPTAITRPSVGHNFILVGVPLMDEVGLFDYQLTGRRHMASSRHIRHLFPLSILFVGPSLCFYLHSKKKTCLNVYPSVPECILPCRSSGKLHGMKKTLHLLAFPLA